MGLGKNNGFKSNSIEYSTPLSLFEPLQKEFDLEIDVCASKENYKCDIYWTKEDNALSKDWVGNCWMNPPFSRELSKWVKKAHLESIKHGGTKVCLIPLRANTKWFGEVVKDAEVRFIIGEVNFNDEPRGLWMPMCILIFGEKANIGKFSTLFYKKA